MNRKAWSAVAIAVGLCGGQVAFAQSSLGTGTDATSARAHIKASTDSVAAALVEVITPSDTVAPMVRHGAEPRLLRELAANPDLSSLEETYPGITAAVQQAALASIEQIVTRGYPSLAARQRDLLATEFTPKELTELLAFLSGPAARHMSALEREAVHGQAGSSNLAQLGDKSAQGNLTSQDLRTAMPQPHFEKLSPLEVAEINKFSVSPTGRKYTAFIPRWTGVLSGWINEIAPSGQAELRNVVLNTVNSYTAMHSKK